MLGANSFVVSPGFGALLGMALVAIAILGGAVTAAKGRWGWALIGLLTGGLLWPFTAFLVAAPDSIWARAFYGPEKLARSVRNASHRRSVRLTDH